MLKKVLFGVLTLALILPTAMPANAVVCGLDGQNYDFAEAAEAAGFDVSYDFACIDPISEEGLYENESDIHFAGMLIEVGSTDVPTNLIIRKNNSSEDITISVSEDTVLGQRKDQYTNLFDWIPGDQIRVIGKKNENTNTVEATILVNLSIKIISNLGANGWITKIDNAAKTITYQWANKEHTFAYDDNTHFVAALKNPASVDDLKINDRIRGRLLARAGEMPLVKIVVVLRRGPNLFMKIRTFRPNAILTGMNSTVIPTMIKVKIAPTPGLRLGDVNNLIGTEGKEINVNVTENTRIVRKYFGKTTLDEFSIGDKLRIVGRINDDGTVDAKLIKNNSIWKTSTHGHAGVVKEVNEDESYIMLKWTPIKHITKKKLKEKLESVDDAVVAQTAVVSTEAQLINDNNQISKESLRSELRERIKSIAPEKVGKFLRIVKNKIMKIGNIRHNNVKLGDLVERMPVIEIRVDVTENTRIVVGTNTNASISDIKAGDRVRVRGVRHTTPPSITAETIVVVSSLPEIEDSLSTEINDINEIASEITTDDTDNALSSNVATDTEDEVVNESDSGSGASEEDVNNS